MAQNSETTTSDLHFIAILLLLAYLMSSAPRYVRQWREADKDTRTETISPVRQVLKAGKVYTIDPFVKAWEAVRPGLKVWARHFSDSDESES